MASLQELLSQSVSQSMGLGDILALRQREAEQLGQATLGAAQTEAQGTINAANTYSNMMKGLGETIGKGIEKKQEADTLAKTTEKKQLFELGTSLISSGNSEQGMKVLEQAGVKLPTDLKLKPKLEPFPNYTDKQGNPLYYSKSDPTKIYDMQGNQITQENIASTKGEDVTVTYKGKPTLAVREGQNYRVGGEIVPASEISPYIKPEKEPTDKGPKILPATNVSALSDINSSINQLDTLAKSAGTIKGLTFTPVDIALSKDPFNVSAKSFNQLVASTKQVIGKGLEGGVLRKEDEAKYDKIIPKLGDTKEVLQNKYSQLRNMLVEKQNSQLTGYEQGGYDVSKFQLDKKQPINIFEKKPLLKKAPVKVAPKVQKLRSKYGY